jgi:hypothetical protein
MLYLDGWVAVDVFNCKFLEHQKKKTYTYPSNEVIDILAVHAATEYKSTRNRAFESDRLEQR